MAIREVIDGNKYDELLGGPGVAVLTKNVMIAAGGSYKRGTVLGVIKDSDKYTIVDKSKSDGSETANAVLAYDADATEGDTVGTVYISGIFNREKLTFGGESTAADHEEQLRSLNIYLSKLM